MRTTSKEKLAELQKCPANVRNICILAHVDHGKFLAVIGKCAQLVYLKGFEPSGCKGWGY